MKFATLLPRRAFAAAGCAIALAGALSASSADAQGTQDAAARQRYDAQIARCNDGNLPAPQREACVRAAGTSLDRSLGGPPADTPVPSADGRATVVTPEGARTPTGGSDAVPSRDGRATIVLPSDGSVRR